jgi:nucleoside-diphosphate-sugar epimerase
MIVGNGLIATAFKNSNIKHDNLVIFASGVSNSKESRAEEYERELSLLAEVIKEEGSKKLIYFSSCSASPTSKAEYNKRKNYIEDFIQETANNYLVLKLPNIVGPAIDNNQLINFFYKSLFNQHKITLNIDCIRYLIDVADLPSIVELLIKPEPQADIINVAFNNGVTVDTIVSYLESATGLTANSIEKVQNGRDYYINNETFLKHIENLNTFNTNPELIIKKYYTHHEA